MLTWPWSPTRAETILNQGVKKPRPACVTPWDEVEKTKISWKSQCVKKKIFIWIRWTKWTRLRERGDPLDGRCIVAWGTIPASWRLFSPAGTADISLPSHLTSELGGGRDGRLSADNLVSQSGNVRRVGAVSSTGRRFTLKPSVSDWQLGVTSDTAFKDQTLHGSVSQISR